MKTNRVLALTMFLASSLFASAQTNVPPAGTNTVETPAPETKAPAINTLTGSDQQPAAPVQADGSGVAGNSANTGSGLPPVGTNDVSGVAGTNSAPKGPPVLPSIAIDDLSLTDAIKFLARQANINYLLDPKVSFGTPGADGHPAGPQPQVSLRWENVTAESALLAVLNNYNLQLIDDPKTKIARITIKDPAAPEPLVTKIIQLKYALASNMVVYASSILQDKRSKVLADVRTSQLVAIGTEKELLSLDEMIARLDTQTKQVLIEARILETSKNPSSTKGIDWSGTLANQNVTFGNGQTFGTTTASSGTTTASTTANGSMPVGSATAPYVAPNTVTTTTTYPAPPGSGLPNTTVITGTGAGTTAGTTAGSVLQTATGNGGLGLNTAKGFFPATAFLNADGVKAALSFLNSDLDATVLSTPRAVTLDNEESILSVFSAQPIFNTTAGTQGSPGGSQVLYTNVGTILKVTPRISANNTVALKVIPEVSDVAGVATKVVGGVENQADIFDVRRIEARVVVPSGNTLVMGGLMSDNRSTSMTKVPGFGDIPLVGGLFRHEAKNQAKKNLIIFITPTIVQGEDFQPTETTFLKTKIPEKPLPNVKAWDSAKKQDWSKLANNKETDENGK